jgi:hypothetical protein
MAELQRRCPAERMPEDPNSLQIETPQKPDKSRVRNSLISLPLWCSTAESHGAGKYSSTGCDGV